jgi:rhodanese-related sulfurtransferase
MPSRSTDEVVWILRREKGAFGMARPIDLEGLRRLMDQGAQIVDVLPAREYGEDHIPGAINLPLRRIETEARQVLDPDRPTVVYCADSG